MKSLIVCTLAAAVASTVAAPTPAWAQAGAEAAAELVRTAVDDALEVLKDPDLQGREKRSERWSKLREVSDRAFDWTAMSRRSLGVHWRKLSEKERERFVDTFRELLANNYLGQIDRFTGKEKLEFKGTSKMPEGFEVKMVLITGSRETVPLDFFVDERPKVYDVSIEGVSIANHYRGVFNRELVNNDFDTLMSKLERKIAVQKRALDREGSSESKGE